MDNIKSAIKAMCQSMSGGYAAMAAALGLSSRAALENRIYEVKGQRVSTEEAMMMQRIADSTAFAEAVAAESGGVFVPLPEAAEFAEGSKAGAILATEPLLNLGKHFANELPNVLMIGAKGAGKTFTFRQVVQADLLFIDRSQTQTV